MEKNLKEIFENEDYRVHIINDGKGNIQSEAEIETWTNGGVNMVFYLKPFTEESFIELVNNFDIDEQIELHRTDQRYKDNFTIQQSLKDFQDFHKRLKNTVAVLQVPKLDSAGHDKEGNNHHQPNKPHNLDYPLKPSECYNVLYVLVEWPDVQDLMKEKWFNEEAILHPDLPESYFIPKNRLDD
jgi:hypothetical protein